MFSHEPISEEPYTGGPIKVDPNPNLDNGEEIEMAPAATPEAMNAPTAVEYRDGNEDEMEEDPEDFPKSGWDILRLRHFTWGWYTWSMSTGGIATLLTHTVQVHSFDGLDTIGKVVFIIELCLFVIFTVLMIARFIFFPGTFTDSVLKPGEALMISMAYISFHTILTCIGIFGIPSCGHWLVVAWHILYWIYLGFAYILSVTLYFALFAFPALHLDEMTPTWMLPIFPVLLAGIPASSVSSHLSPDDAFGVQMSALSAQGMGYLICMMLFAVYMLRLVQFGLPPANARPAMMIAVAPPAYTASAFVELANAYPVLFTGYFFGDNAITSQVLRVVGTMAAMFLYAFAIFLLFIAFVSILKGWRELTFHLNWWAFVFPNVGLINATVSLSKVFKHEGFIWVGQVLTCVIIAVYLFVLCMMVRAVYLRQILWPGTDEDKYVVRRRRKVYRFVYEQN